MTTIRAVRENQRPQGTAEEIAYYVDTAPWGGYDSNMATTILGPNGDDVSLVHLSGVTSEVGGVITTPLVKLLSPGHMYRLQILWKKGANIFQAYCDLVGEA